jgi:predicted MFS family arabinose efflux permease
MIDDPKDLSNAIALNSSMFNSARLVGPALAATILSLAGAGFCFLLNALSYIAVIAALLAMRVRPHSPKPSSRRWHHEMREGFSYAAHFAPIRSLLLMIGVVSMASTVLNTLLPIMATQLLSGKVGTFGVLTIAGGVGALVGAVMLASRNSVLGLGRWICAAPIMLGLGLLAISVAPVIWLAVPLQIVIGFATMVHLGSSNIVLQTIVDEDKRGRIMSLYTMAFMGTAPLGSLSAGYLAKSIGSAHTLQVAAVISLTCGVIFVWHFQRLRTLVRPIYVRLGIIPAVTSEVYPNLPPATPLEPGK